MIASLAYRAAAHLLSPGGPGARLTIMIFHRVVAEPDPLQPREPTVEVFFDRMRRLKQVFNVLPLDEAARRLREGTLPPRAASITFDDGYADNLTLATPVLQKLGLHGTFFVATGFLDGGRMFNDTVVEAIRRSNRPSVRPRIPGTDLGELDLSTVQAKRAAVARLLPAVKPLLPDQRVEVTEALARELTDQPLPDDLMMSTAQLRALGDSGMAIGGHTVSHPILARMNNQAAAEEIDIGRKQLERVLGRRVALFAYPNGRPMQDYSPHQAALVRELGFDAAVSTQRGAAWSGSDPFQLPRVTPWAPRAYRFVPRLLGNLRSPA